jgi:hypothetical protein
MDLFRLCLLSLPIRQARIRLSFRSLSAASIARRIEYGSLKLGRPVEALQSGIPWPIFRGDEDWFSGWIRSDLEMKEHVDLSDKVQTFSHACERPQDPYCNR